MDEGDVSVHLALATDTSGYVNFTGVNVAEVGLTSLASFITTQSKVPTLAAKATGKRTRTVTVNFTISPKPLKTEKKNAATGQTYNCDKFTLFNNPATRLYVKEWLDDYFYRINWDYKHKPIPNQLKIQSVELSSAIYLAVDISGGATPNVLGNGSTFILPVNGLSLDYSPDYSHKIDLTLNVCDNSTNYDDPRPMPCFSTTNTDLPVSLLYQQCHIYSYLVPLLSGVKPPKDIPVDDKVHRACDKAGNYVIRPNPPANMQLEKNTELTPEFTSRRVSWPVKLGELGKLAAFQRKNSLNRVGDSSV
jgi:hypothetical protein